MKFHGRSILSSISGFAKEKPKEGIGTITGGTTKIL